MKKISLESIKNLKLNDSGLNDQEVNEQTKNFGQNEIIKLSQKTWYQIFFETLKDPMIWFLAIIGIIYLFLGNQTEALTLFIAILPLLLMDLFLHWRTEASTASLSTQLSTTTYVIRDQKRLQIPSVEIVPGDLVILNPGDYIPADGLFQKCENLQVDESLITGESLPIFKHFTNQSLDATELIIKPDNWGQAGTRVLSGNGLMRIIFTSASTTYGQIVRSISQVPSEKTPLQKGIETLVKYLIFISLLACFLLAGVRIYQGYPWIDAIVAALVLALAAVPEEFPVVFTFYLGVGVYRLAKKKTLVRRAVSVENIGRVNIICTDKTGTITKGELKLTHIFPEKNLEEKELLQIAAMASDPNNPDPIDVILRKDHTDLAPIQKLFPFTEDRRRETAIINQVAYTKGSPETIISMCKGQLQDWLEKTQVLASEGHKVIACARREVSELTEPMDSFEFCGLLAFEDPARDGVKESIEYCNQNQIKVLMLTGDHPATAMAIAKEVSLGSETPKVMTGKEQFTLNELLETDVIARCTPLQKLNIVMMLKKSGAIIAVTGDGVNDVPALKAADIGIAMGERGTQSAKEVASMILVDDNFKTIVSSIQEGRQLTENLRMSFLYLLLIHLPFVATAAIIPLLGYPLLYLPIHIVWLELIIHPSCMLAFQQNSSKKHQAQGALLSLKDFKALSFLGLIMTIFITTSFHLAIKKNLGIEHARSIALGILIFWSAGIVISLNSFKGRIAWLISLLTMLSFFIMTQIPGLAKVTHLSTPDYTDWIIILFTLLLSTFLISVAKGKKFIN
ncbi:MAG: cation-translocating P-type ATPase [Bacteriovoracaceae bacterium]